MIDNEWDGTQDGGGLVQSQVVLFVIIIITAI